MSEGGWIERHRPDSWDEIQANNKALNQIRSWIENWSRGDSPQLLVGVPGTGKTTTAFVAADTMDVPLNKVNLSLKRRSHELKQAARSARTTPPDEDFQLVLFDEIDSMYHSVNKEPLYEVLRDAPNPIIVTANDEYSVPDPVKKACDVHTFKLGTRSIKAKVKEIAEAEGIDLSPSDLNRLGDRSGLRDAINDLQTLAGGGDIGMDKRTSTENEFSAVESLVKGEDKEWRDALSLNSDTFDGIDSAILWADDNLTLQFRGLEAGVAYQTLAYADLWAGRAWERQNFRYQKFGWEMLQMLPETRLSEPYTGYIQDNMFPTWFRHSEAKYDGDSPEARVYRKMKGERGYSFSASFYEFRERILPILRDLPQEDRLQLAMNSRLDPDEVGVLDLPEEEYIQWRGDDTVEAGEGWKPDTQSAADADW